MTSAYDATATLVVLIISIFFVIRPITIPTPHPLHRIPINLATVPILAIALLWATQCLDLAVIRGGIAGTEGVKPYSILIHIFSLAYMAITLNVVVAREDFSVDDTFTAYTIPPFLAYNIFVALALQYHTMNRVPQRPACCTTYHLDPFPAHPDPVGAWVGSVILSATLILCPVAGFLEIDAWTISLPFAAGKLLFDLGWDQHRYAHPTPVLGCGLPGAVGRTGNRPTVDEGQRPEDTLIYTPSSDREKSSHSLLDEATPLHLHSLGSSMLGRELFKAGEKGLGEGSLAEEHQHTQNPLHQYSLADTKRSLVFPPNDGTAIGSPPETSSKPNLQSSAPGANIRMSHVLKRLRSHMDYQSDQLVARFPTFIIALPQMPLPLIPFTFSQFILVEALDQQGWVDVFANWLVRASGNQIHLTIWLTGVLSLVLCNLSATNIGATILLTKVVGAAALPYDANRAAVTAVAVASSVGAVSFTFSASPASLLWRGGQKGTPVGQREFAS